MSLAYLATPYSKYPAGIQAAFEDACLIAAKLISKSIDVYSPIAHTHPIAIHGKLDPLDLDIWLPFDEAMMAKADTLIVAHLPGWESSRGIQHEISVFKSAGKPIFDLDPDTMMLTRRRDG